MRTQPTLLFDRGQMAAVVSPGGRTWARPHFCDSYQCGPSVAGGLAAARRGDWDDAERQFSRLISTLDPTEDADTWNLAAAWYAVVLVRRGGRRDVEKAAGMVAQAAELSQRTPSPAPRPVPARGRDDGLTTREFEVLSHIAAGETNWQIAAELSISVHTVTRHVTHILEKLSVPNRAAAAAQHRENGPSVRVQAPGERDSGRAR